MPADLPAPPPGDEPPGAAPAGIRPTPATLVLARTPHPPQWALCTALAHGFLACDDWTTAELMGAGSRVLGARRRWLAAVVRQVLGTFRSPPHDSPRTLAGIVAATPALQRAIAAATEKRSPIPFTHTSLAPTAIRPTSVHIPAVGDLGILAGLLGLHGGELDWFAETANWNRRHRPGALHPYRYEWKQRPGRAPRLLEVPGARLRAVQRAVLSEILSPIPLHDAAHGFVAGRSALTGAALHTGSAVVISLDLSTFFARVTAPRIFGTLRQAGYPDAVAHTLTGLVTHAVPPWVTTAMPAGGDPEERFALRRALAVPHLPQGAPTSPMLANLSVRRLDSRLAGWADAAGATYTRYADDLAFSGDGLLARRADAFIRGAGRIVNEEGHSLNPAKTRVRGSSIRQSVTGIVVNVRTNAPRREVDRLAAIIHNCVATGPAAQNRDGHPEFRAHLLGRISWVESLNPARGRRLREDFANIAW